MARPKKDMLVLLGRVSLFEGLSRKELESILAAGKEITHGPEHEIVEEGATGVGFHLIVEGEAEVLVGGVPRAKLGAGDYFGEMSLLDGGPRSATVRSVTPLRTLALTSWAFMPILDKSPSMARKLLQEMSKRLRHAEDSLRH